MRLNALNRINTLNSFGAKKAGQLWSSYWKSQTGILLFFGQIKNISDSKLYNEMSGASDYLTIGGSAGSYTFQAPNNATYKAADTDYIWFNESGSQRITTESELVGYNLQRTPVKYDNDTPNSIRWIAILKRGVVLTATQRNNLFKTFELPIMWDNVWNDYGYEKTNRSNNETITWVPQSGILSSLVADANKDKIVITFDITLDDTSIPTTSAFVCAGKTITNVAIVGTALTLTVDNIFDMGDVISVTYTKPSLNFLKNSTGDYISSFTQAIINNISAPNFFFDGNTKIWKDNTDAATITKDESNYVSRINHKLGGAIYYTASGTGKPQLQANNELLYDGVNDTMNPSAAPVTNIPFTVYFVFRVITHAYPRPLILWNSSYGTGFLVGNPTKVKIYHGITSADFNTLSPNTLNIAVMKIQGANSTMSINGAAETVFDSGSNVGGVNTAVIFSANGTMYPYLNAAEKELIFRAGGDTPENRIKGYNYLKTKHNL